MSWLLSSVNWTFLEAQARLPCHICWGSHSWLSVGFSWLVSLQDEDEQSWGCPEPTHDGAAPCPWLCLMLYSLGWVSLHIWPAIPPQKSWPFAASCTPGNSLLLGRDSLLRTCRSSQGLCSQIKTKWQHMFTRGSWSSSGSQGEQCSFPKIFFFYQVFEIFLTSAP